MSIVDDAREKWTGAINEVTIGATKADGGTRTSVVTVGGASALPFMHFEGGTPRAPARSVRSPGRLLDIAMSVAARAAASRVS